MIARMAGVAPRELCFAGLGTLGNFLQVIDDVVAVAHRVDTVFHPVFLLRIQSVHIGYPGGMLPVYRGEKFTGLAGMTFFAGGGTPIAVLFDKFSAGMVFGQCRVDRKSVV